MKNQAAKVGFCGLLELGDSFVTTIRPKPKPKPKKKKKKKIGFRFALRWLKSPCHPKTDFSIGHCKIS